MVRTVGADGQPLGNKKIKLPLAHELSARAMARALWLHWAVRVVVLPTRISSVDEHTRHRSCLSTCGVTPWVKG
jgi:hypothetical protein